MVRGLAALALGVLSLLWVTPAGADAAVVPTWSTLSPPQSPSGLQYASEAYDADDQTVVLFGGLESNGSVSGATWIWNGTTWSQAAAQISGPQPSQGAAMAYSPTLHQLILFGGLGADGSVLNDTWAWNGQSWYQEASGQPASGPAAREGASLAADANGDLVLFGGTGTSGGGSADSAASVGSAATGDPVVPAAEPPTPDAPAPTDTPASSDAPAPSDTPTAAEVPTSADTPTPSNAPAPAQPTAALPVAAGPGNVTDASVSGGATTFDDTWEWDGTAWSQTGQSNPPPARTDASLTWDASINETILFGGSATPLSGGATPLDDTWAWSANGWSQLNPSDVPPARYDALSSAAGGLSSDVVAGGLAGSGSVNDDIWSFSGSTWSPLKTGGTLVTRSGAAAAWDDSAGQLVVFGGVGTSGNTLADTVVLTEAAPVTVTPTTGPTPTTAAPTTTPGTVTPTTPLATTSPSSGASPTTNPGAVTPGTTSPGGSTTAPSSTSSVKDTTTAPTTTTTVPATTSPTTDARVTAPGTGPAPTSPSHPVTPTSQTPGTLVAPVQTVHTGSLVTVLGSGFLPGAVVTITFHSKPYTVGRAIAGPTGSFSATVTVPETASPGEHHLEATGMSPSGTLDVLLTPLKVVPFSSGSSKGTSSTTWIMVGVAVFLPVGTWIALSLRSRRHPSPAH
jgi:hypothetical protein